MRVLVAVCFTKYKDNMLNTRLDADIIEANSQEEALGRMVKRMQNDEQLGSHMAKEIKK